MSRENVEIVRGVYEAIAQGDPMAVLAAYDPEVEWDFSQGPLGRSVEDHCDELIDAGDKVVSVVTSTGTGRASGAPGSR